MLIAEKIRAAEERSIGKNIEISVIMSNFAILLKVMKIIIDSYVEEGNINIQGEKIALIEKLFLLSRFAHPPIREKLIQMIITNKSALKKSE